MTDLTRERERGEHARQILANPEFDASMEDVRRASLDAIAMTPVKDAETREFLYRWVRSLPMLREALIARMNSGELAAAQMLEFARQAEIEKKAKSRLARQRGRGTR